MAGYILLRMVFLPQRIRIFRVLAEAVRCVGVAQPEMEKLAHDPDEEFGGFFFKEHRQHGFDRLTVHLAVLAIDLA